MFMYKYILTIVITIITFFTMNPEWGMLFSDLLCLGLRIKEESSAVSANTQFWPQEPLIRKFMRRRIKPGYFTRETTTLISTQIYYCIYVKRAYWWLSWSVDLAGICIRDNLHVAVFTLTAVYQHQWPLVSSMSHPSGVSLLTRAHISDTSIFYTYLSAEKWRNSKLHL